MKTISNNVLIILMMGIFFSCQNDMKTIKELTALDTDPSQIIENATYIFTKKGNLENKLSARVLKQYSNDSTYIVIEEGLKMEIFDDSEVKTAELTSKCGLFFEDKGLMEATDSVVFSNTKGEKLLTEKLTWLQDSSIIYSDMPIVIYRDESVIYGDGIVSNESFSKYTIDNPRGELDVKLKENELD